ncbi:MAG: hypothetical protein RR416_02540 [Clostridia bacterium]
MKKRTLSIMVTVIMVVCAISTIAISYAAWDQTQDTNSVTLSAGQNVIVSLTDSNFDQTKPLVPTGTIAAGNTDKYVTELSTTVTVNVTNPDLVKTLKATQGTLKITSSVATGSKDLSAMKDQFVVTISGDPATVGATNVYTISIKFADGAATATDIEKLVEASISFDVTFVAA